jgi:xanthosine utilization system XapX-like protein
MRTVINDIFGPTMSVVAYDVHSLFEQVSSPEGAVVAVVGVVGIIGCEVVVVGG